MPNRQNIGTGSGSEGDDDNNGNEQRAIDSNTAILQACLSGSLDDVKLLLNSVLSTSRRRCSQQQQQQQRQPIEFIFNSIKDANGNTALIYAAENGHRSVVSYLIEQQGVDINRSNDDGVTALMRAGELGHLDIVEMLLDRGADLHMKASSGYSSALLRAASGGHSETALCLLKRGAKPNETDRTTGYSAFLLASKCGSLQTMRYLVEHGAKVDIKAKDGSTALSLAPNEDVAFVVKCLLESPLRPVKQLLFISLGIGFTVAYLLTLLPMPLRNS